MEPTFAEVEKRGGLLLRMQSDLTPNPWSERTHPETLVIVEPCPVGPALPLSRLSPDLDIFETKL